uniref:Ribosomal eL28/Mak16 domain-containing protein n=2 Tax=Eukaryota TaxID=2759 RepID=A0A7S1SRK2_9CHLO|mmetsp:Transcript_255/g.428  ORF Transcript_255/g.428 Transcript_255/m.428 type:complete len:128 (+) Transcript_255:115-498(+)|eukprot:CAMPEP_0168625790 /NCGR_PEP_ID=MMETSP0449_2-20121227/10234_1 /TAXON_ID=1082188 /ORGANISM="Strombidium rassoulzadegani, Strain ras09" /LENGTH=127 /DNA_ID=CAMNT_0008667637 /DNA_START=49 /DNA_END=432 /DNA_ORIENTATION=+
MSDALVWQLVKAQNAFLKRNVNNTWWSAEKGNLYGKHSYKYSGLCNSKTVDISPTDSAVVLTKSKPTKGRGKPAKAKASTVMKKDMRRMAKTVSKEVGNFRPDLKGAALSRLSACQKSLRVIKSGSK